MSSISWLLAVWVTGWGCVRGQGYVSATRHRVWVGRLVGRCVSLLCARGWAVGRAAQRGCGVVSAGTACAYARREGAMVGEGMCATSSRWMGAQWIWSPAAAVVVVVSHVHHKETTPTPHADGWAGGHHHRLSLSGIPPSSPLPALGPARAVAGRTRRRVVVSGHPLQVYAAA